MVCKHCGATSDGISRFCTNCGADLYVDGANAENVAPPTPNYQQSGYQQPGYQQPNYQQPNYQQPGYPYQNYQNPNYNVPQNNGANGYATASLVMGIISIICMGWIWSVLAFCFASAAKKRGYVGGKTKAGIVCGVIGLVLCVVVLAFGFAG